MKKDSVTKEAQNVALEQAEQSTVSDTIEPGADIASEHTGDSENTDDPGREEAPKESDSAEDIAPKSNQITEEDVKNMSYWELWGYRREGGMFYHVATSSFYTFLIYLFLRICYLFYIRDLSHFGINWWSIPLCIIVGLLYWFIHEAIYKKKMPERNQNKPE